MSNQTFIRELQVQAKKQSKLSNSRLLPAELDGITSLIGNYPWQTTLIFSFLLAVAVTWFGLEV